MKNILILLGMFFTICACNTQEVQTYMGKDYIQFLNKKKSFIEYSFVYAGSHVKRDTVWFRALCTGSTSQEIRSFRVKQVPEYVFSYRYDENGSVRDSVLVLEDNQAEPGVHYVPFDDPGYQQLCIVPADSVTFMVPVILLRDLSLKEQEKTLLLEFVANDDFNTGDPYTLWAHVRLSDILTYPAAWSDYVFGNGIEGTNPIFGEYGKVKHQLLIDITGKPWDNEFIDGLDYEEELMYKNMASKELDRINRQRAEQGEPPLMEDPNNPNSVVEFP